MTTNPYTRPFLLSGVVTLVLSFPAMVAFMTMFTKDLATTLNLASTFSTQLVAGYAAMFLFLFFTQGAARACSHAALLMGAYFIAVFLVGVLFASATSLMIYAPSPWETSSARMHSYLAKPIMALAVWGSLPAFLVGLLGHGILRLFASGVTKRLDALYAREGSRVDPSLTKAQAEVQRRERW
jgi:heme/copper-type cytochrome/quinol oxidase subunit 4